ncbi:endonuclease/exonuclease/phosphatase family protein [Candidatus Daviesbacteria bacterium]|nr:endonuclease/exonuclease/phosphatase family protein [Candidatus Daviesbacteria bacterium]
MKLISLNTWGGKVFEPLINFIKQSSADTDIFCLQEIYNTTSEVKQYQGIRANLLKEIKKILPDYQVFYFPILFGIDDQTEPVNFNLQYGLAVFIKNNIRVDEHKDYFIYKSRQLDTLKKNFSNLSTPLQYLTFTFNNKQFSVFNYHGTPYPLTHKLDAPNRLKQVKKAKNIIENKKGAKILVGDFNLLPETESLKILGQGMRNLIKEYQILRTRSNLSPFYGGPNFQKFADYTFISKNVKVSDFQVLEVEISDHLPMILEFS